MIEKIKKWFCSHESRTTKIDFYDKGVRAITTCDNCGKGVSPHNSTEIDNTMKYMLHEKYNPFMESK